MSRLPQRWRTQRNAIRNANCKTSWIIKILNAHCALRKCLRAYLFECLYTPLIPVMYVMYVAGDGLWFWTLRKWPSLLECIWQAGTCFLLIGLPALVRSALCTDYWGLCDRLVGGEWGSANLTFQTTWLSKAMLSERAGSILEGADMRFFVHAGFG